MVKSGSVETPPPAPRFSRGSPQNGIILEMLSLGLTPD